MFKKYFLQSMLALTAILLAACGGTDTTAERNNSGTAESNEVQSDQRIVVTTTAVMNILETLNLDVIGIPTTEFDVPERYKGVTEVGNPMSPDVEIIASLKPTEVFSVTSLEYDLKPSFEQLNIPTTFVNLQGIEQMKQGILDIGNRYERTEEAEQLVASMDEEIARLSSTIEGEDKPKVLILLGIPGSYLVASENSYIGDLVRLAGGENVTAGATAEYLPSNTEYLQQSNPDVILRLSHGMPDEVVKMFDEEFKTNDIWKHFSAVQNDRVYDLKEPLFGTTATLEVTTALQQLIEILYP